MKKLLVLSLVVVLTLSLAAIASAATFDPYVGGRITWAYMSVSEDAPAGMFPATDKAPVTYDKSGLKMKLQGKVSDEETGTWATIGVQINDGWNGADDGSIANDIKDFGINKIGGSNVNVWYTNWENENMKRGQDRIRDITVDMYHRDPMFDHAMQDVIGVDYITDNVVLNFGYEPNKVYVVGADELELNPMQVAGTFKFDGGDVHFGYFSRTRDLVGNTYEMTETLIGANVKLGFGSLAVDYVGQGLGKNEDGDSAKDVLGTIDEDGNVDEYSGGSQIQAKVSFTDLRLDVTVLLDSKYTFVINGGTGFEIRYGINDKLYVGYAALNASDENEQAVANMTDMYIGYKYGVFDFRAGSGTKGAGDDVENNGVTYVSCYASLW